MKLPKNFQKMYLWVSRPRKRPRRINAATRDLAPQALRDNDSFEPTTRISTALFIVLILHVVAIGGIYAFNQMKYKRLAEEGLLHDAKNPMQQTAASETEAPPPPIAAPAALSNTAAAAPATPAPSTAPVAAGKIYHVRSGDTFARIAGSNGVGTAELISFNGLKESSTLHVGESLNIPVSKTVKASAGESHKLDAASKAGTPGASKAYTVKKGDTPLSIAHAMNVPYEELLKLNKIDDPKKLQIGAVLKLPPAKKSKPDPGRT